MSIAHYEVVELLHPIKPRVLTLGESFILELAKVPNGRGLAAAYEQIKSVIGTARGSRNTFGKLQRAQSFESLNQKDRERAWILMATLGMNPADFGASDVGAPPKVNIEALRADLLLPDLDSNQEPAGYSLAPVINLSNLTVRKTKVKLSTKNKRNTLGRVTQIMVAQ